MSSIAWYNLLMSRFIVLLRIITHILKISIVLAVLLLTLGASNSAAPASELDNLRAFTRSQEFDFVWWTVKALAIKWGQGSLGVSEYLSEAARQKIVLEYLDLVLECLRKQQQINQIYSDPRVADPEAESTALRKEFTELTRRRDELGPLAEAIVQSQISTVVSDMGLEVSGQTIPPVLYHTTEPPWGLVISRRDRIEQIENISLDPALTVDQLEILEDEIDQARNVSTLAVGIGGIGLYPTMVMQTWDVNWLMEVVSHEWVHNFLTLHPLGVSYLNSPPLRIINETTADIAGVEIGAAVIKRFYPEKAPSPPAAPHSNTNQTRRSSEPMHPADFQFNAYMHSVRVTVDHLLAEGKVEEAETFMEYQRKVFAAHGYLIRKINQAYFAFYGAYASQPGGAAGNDPVGEAVRKLRAQSASLTNFLNQIAWVYTWQQLQEMVTQQ